MGRTEIRSGTVSVVTPPSAPGHAMTACSSRSPDTCGCTCQLNRMLTSSPMDLSIVSSGVTVASEAITDSLARTIVPTVTSTGSGSRGTSVGTVALILACRSWASPMLSAMLSVWPSVKKAGACHSALRVIMRRTSGGAGAGGAAVKARDGLGPGGAGGAGGAGGLCELMVRDALGPAGCPASCDEAQAESTRAASAVASSAMTLVVRIATT